MKPVTKADHVEELARMASAVSGEVRPDPVALEKAKRAEYEAWRNEELGARAAEAAARAKQAAEERLERFVLAALAGGHAHPVPVARTLLAELDQLAASSGVTT